jgi:hypothetical protein
MDRPATLARPELPAYMSVLYPTANCAAIGIVATIALGIFGQMAERWKDMNA